MGAAIDSPKTGWLGGHHLALATSDLDATVRFYHHVLGMPLFGANPAAGQHGKHCYFRAGNLIMHFFETPAPSVLAPDGWQSGELRMQPTAYQHMAIALETPDELASLRKRLEAAGVQVTPLGNEGPIQYFRFVDNNGIMLEAVWSPLDTATMPVDYHNPGLFGDDDPVPAVKEIID